MKSTRLHFKYALRNCKRNESRIKSDKLANKLLAKDSISFWKGIKNSNTSSHVLANNIDGVTGTDNISDFWKDKYCNLLNSNLDISRKKHVMETIRSIDECERVKYTCKDIHECIQNLKSGKGAGLDNLQGEHFKYAPAKLSVLLAMLINTMMLHGYLPEDVMKTVIIPIV